MKDELGRKILANIVGLRAKTYTFLIDDRSEDKKANLNLKVIKAVQRQLNLRIK